MLFKILSSTVVCIYMQSMHGLVCVCSMGTAGKEVVLAGITWFSKCQGFDVVPQCSAAEVLQGSLEPTLRGRTETKLPVYPHKPAEVSHSWPVCSSHTPWSLSCLNSQDMCVCVCIRALKTEWKCVLCQFVFVSFSSSASVYVGLWSCVSLPACSRVWTIIPVCWQSRRTEGSVCADLNPLHLNCHLEDTQREREKKIASTSSKQI